MLNVLIFLFCFGYFLFGASIILGCALIEWAIDKPIYRAFDDKSWLVIIRKSFIYDTSSIDPIFDLLFPLLLHLLFCIPFLIPFYATYGLVSLVWRALSRSFALPDGLKGFIRTVVEKLAGKDVLG